MAGDVPSTLSQMMKLVWKNEELVNHGKGSHSGRHALITVDLVNSIGEDFAS